MSPRSKTLERWWPTTQSLDLVDGPVERVAEAVHAEVARFVGADSVASSWTTFQSLEAAFDAAPDFTNVPTYFLVLPTRSNWTVLWNNSFLCDGYDALCWCLTANHRLTTLHWCAHDDWTTFQSGASFCYRRWHETKVVERSVYVAQEDKHWVFTQRGETLPEEDVDAYAAKRKKDRLNEELMSRLLTRLGAAPWQEDFYAVPEARSFVIRRTSMPSTVLHKRRADVVRAG